jgi:hypothetical protein
LMTTALNLNIYLMLINEPLENFKMRFWKLFCALVLYIGLTRGHNWTFCYR